MCGIAGILNLAPRTPGEEELFLRMISILKHRGPDETGAYIDPGILLGHSRLSIIGIDDGTQPLSNEDGTLWISYNGEAFNYLELREELVRQGHRFRTSTDTEVLLHLYEDLGPGFLERINGQFAVAIWDSKRKELFLARDRVGIRPLYYCRNGGKFLFASEIKAIFMDPGVPREIDPRSLAQIFTFWTTSPPRTAFKGVFELPPGHYAKVSSDGEMHTERYWSIPLYGSDSQWNGSFEEAAEELRSLLKDAVRLRLRADVPVGAYLSGGLDSSILTALISRCFNNRLRTFSLSFQENPFDESSFQRELVEFLGTDHREVSISNADIADRFADTVWFCEKPLLRTAPVPMYLLSKLVRQNDFKVVLTGEGADEIFGGYNIFKEAKIRYFWGRRPDSELRPMLIEKLYPYIFRNPSRTKAFLREFFSVKEGDAADPLFSHLIRWNNSGKNLGFLSADVRNGIEGYSPVDELRGRLPDRFSEYEVLPRAQYLEMDIFLSNYLLSSQGDRVGMGNSVEMRHPYLDFRVIDFAAKLPPRWKIRGLNEKYILKEAFRGWLPDSINRRPKHPYRAPIREVFQGKTGGSFMDDLLSERSLSSAGYFDERKVGFLLAKFRKEAPSAVNETQNMALVGILSTQLLHRQYLEEFPGERIRPVIPDKIVRR